MRNIEHLPNNQRLNRINRHQDDPESKEISAREHIQWAFDNHDKEIAVKALLRARVQIPITELVDYLTEEGSLNILMDKIEDLEASDQRYLIDTWIKEGHAHYDDMDSTSILGWKIAENPDIVTAFSNSELFYKLLDTFCNKTRNISDINLLCRSINKYEEVDLEYVLDKLYSDYTVVFLACSQILQHEIIRNGGSVELYRYYAQKIVSRNPRILTSILVDRIQGTESYGIDYYSEQSNQTYVSEAEESLESNEQPIVTEEEIIRMTLDELFKIGDLDTVINNLDLFSIELTGDDFSYLIESGYLEDLVTTGDLVKYSNLDNKQREWLYNRIRYEGMEALFISAVDRFSEESYTEAYTDIPVDFFEAATRSDTISVAALLELASRDMTEPQSKSQAIWNAYIDQGKYGEIGIKIDLFTKQGVEVANLLRVVDKNEAKKIIAKNSFLGSAAFSETDSLEILRIFSDIEDMSFLVKSRNVLSGYARSVLFNRFLESTYTELEGSNFFNKTWPSNFESDVAKAISNGELSLDEIIEREGLDFFFEDSHRIKIFSYLDEETKEKLVESLFRDGDDALIINAYKILIINGFTCLAFFEKMAINERDTAISNAISELTNEFSVDMREILSMLVRFGKKAHIRELFSRASTACFSNKELEELLEARYYSETEYGLKFFSGISKSHAKDLIDNIPISKIAENTEIFSTFPIELVDYAVNDKRLFAKEWRRIREVVTVDELTVERFKLLFEYSLEGLTNEEEVRAWALAHRKDLKEIIYRNYKYYFNYISLDEIDLEYLIQKGYASIDEVSNQVRAKEKLINLETHDSATADEFLAWARRNNLHQEIFWNIGELGKQGVLLELEDAQALGGASMTGRNLDIVAENILMFNSINEELLEAIQQRSFSRNRSACTIICDRFPGSTFSVAYRFCTKLLGENNVSDVSMDVAIRAYNGELSSDERRNIGVRGEKDTALNSILQQLEKFRARVLQTNPLSAENTHAADTPETLLERYLETTKRDFDNIFYRDYFRVFCRQKSSKWGSHLDSSFSKVVSYHLKAVEEGRVHQIPEHYRESETIEIKMQVSSEEKEFTYTAAYRDRFNVLQNSVRDALALLEVSRPYSAIVEEAEEVRRIYLEKYDEELQNYSDQDKLHKFIDSLKEELKNVNDPLESNMLRKKIEALENTDRIGFIIKSIESKIASLKAIHLRSVKDFELNLVKLQSIPAFEPLIRKVLVLKALKMHRNQVDVAKEISIARAEDLEAGHMLIEFFDHVVHNETWSKIVSSKQARRSLKGVLNTSAILNDVRRDQQSRNGGHKTTSLNFIPTRGLLMEFSGHMADACWANKYNSIAETFPNMFSVSMIQNKGTNNERVAGACMFIETTDETGQDLLIVRGLNPIMNVVSELQVEDFYDKFIAYARSLADSAGRKLAIVIDNNKGGSASNRQSVYDHLSSIKPTLEMAIIGKDDTTFNGYDITRYTYLVD